GAFAIGVLLALRERSSKWAFTHYVGTSTGALIVPLALLEEYSLLEQLYTSVTTADILKKYNVLERFFQQSLFDSIPLWNLINQYYTNERCERLLAAERYVYLTTTCLQTERLTVFTSHPQPEPSEQYDLEKLTGPDHLRKAILASASQPVFMTPVKVNLHVDGARHPQHQYVDGGVLQYAGIEMAIDQGAQDILTILLSPAEEKVAKKEFKGLFSILQQTIGIFTSDVGKNDLIIPLQYNDALLYIDAVKKKMEQSGLPRETVENYFRLPWTRNPYA
ncbi:MAG: patatin-like phospholipase family protein, partial [Chitinophagaceae bacterium]